MSPARSKASKSDQRGKTSKASSRRKGAVGRAGGKAKPARKDAARGARTKRSARTARTTTEPFTLRARGQGPAITPFLMFPKGAKEAVELYTSTFPDGRILSSGSMGKGPDGTELWNAQFEVGGQRLNAMDGGPSFSFAQGTSLMVACRDQAEIDRVWDALTSGGGQPGPCGWLTDRFGLSWQVVPARLGEWLGHPDPRKAQACMQAMLQMSKMDVATFERLAR